MADEEEVEEDLPSLHVVTIMWEEGAGPAQVDLGHMSPWVAISLLNMVTDSLEMVLHPPTIRYADKVIFEAVCEPDSDFEGD